MRSVAKSLSLAATLLLTAAAYAGSIPSDLFTLTCGGTTITYVVPVDPTPDIVVSGDIFELYVTANVPGGTAVDLIGFFTTDNEGGLEDSYLGITPDGVDQLGDPQQVFTGSTTNPQFVTGTYTMIDPDATLVISTYDPLVPNAPPDPPDPFAASAPEPSSWMLLATGMAGICLLARSFGLNPAMGVQAR